MKRFTELLEDYNEHNLKSLFKEEATEDEFNKEVEEVKKKDAGKIRNKKIASAAVQAVEIQKEEATEDEDLELNEEGFGPLGWYAHHHKTGQITLHKSRKDADKACRKHDIKKGKVVSSAGAYYNSGNEGIADKAFGMHQSGEGGISESNEKDDKPIWGKPNMSGNNYGDGDREKPDYSKTGKLYKKLKASADKIKSGGIKEGCSGGKPFKDLYGKRKNKDEEV
jgi:hypothetical protein